MNISAIVRLSGRDAGVEVRKLGVLTTPTGPWRGMYRYGQELELGRVSYL